MATQSKHDVTTGVMVAHSKLKDNRRQTEGTQRTTRGESMERMHRSRQAIDAHKLADETEFSTGILNVPSYRNDDINDTRTKSTIAQKSGASTPGKAGAVRDRSNGSGEATPSISLLRQQPQRYLGTVFETAGGTSATRYADLSAVTPMPIKGSSNAAMTFLGRDLFSTRTSQAGASSPAVQALGGLRRVRSTSSTAGGASSAAYGHKELGPENTGVPATSHVADAAIALVRASEVLRSNWRSMEGPKRSDSEASEREQQERQEDVGRNSGKRKAKRPASAVLGVRQRVAAAAPMALASALSSGGGGATEGPAHKRQQRLRSPQITLAGAGRDWEEWEAVGNGGGVYRQVHNISEGGAKWRGRRDDVPMARSVPRAAADTTAFGSNAMGAPVARGQRGGCIHSFTSSSSSDDDKLLSRDRGIVGTGPGRRVGISSGGLDAEAARRRSGSAGGGLMTGGWFELASSNLITTGGAGRSTGGGGGRSTGGVGVRSTGGGGGRGTDGCAGRSTGGGGQGILHSYTYNISSSSSSTSDSHDSEREDAAQQVDAVNNLVGKRSTASPRGVRASDGGGLTAITSIASSTALAPQESAGMSKLRGQLQRARQSLLRLQLSSGGGGPPLPQDAVGSRRSGAGGLGASQGGMGPNMGAGSGRGVHGGDDRSHDVIKGFPDDDISMLLSALLEGQLSSTQERYSAAAMAAAAATSGGGIRVRFAAEYPNGAAAAGSPRDAAHGDEDDDDCEDEPWRIAARPLPPGKLVRLLRALQQLHLRNPQLLRSRRHGRRLWRLLQGVASGDGEAEMLLDAVTGGRGAVGAAPMQRRAFNDRSSGGGSAVAALAAAMFGVGGGPTKSGDGDISGNDIRFRAVAPAGQRQLRTDRGTALEVKPSAARSLVQWQEASLLAQEAEEQEAWREVARTREVRGLDAAGKMRNYQGMDRTGYSPRSYGGAASLAVAANVPSRPRCSDGASPVSGRRSSSAHASPQATATSPNSRAHQVVAAAARSNSAGAGRSAASSSAAGSTRTRSTAAVAAAKMPDDAQHSPLRLLPVAITAAAAAAGRSSPGSPTITAASSRVRRTSEVKEQATAVAGGARSRSPTSLGGKGPGSPSPSNQFLQPARFPSSNDATPADAGTPPSLDKSQSSSRQPAAVWRNSLIAIVGPSAQPDTAENSLVLPQAVAGTVAGRSKSPAKMPTYAPSHALLKPSSNSPGLPWSGGGTAAATMTPEIPFLGARRPVSPTVDMSNTTGNGKGRWQPTLPQQLPSEVAMAVPGQSLMKARSASPALARSATAAGSVDGRARQLASAADRSPTVSTTNALERTPAPSIAGASPRHAGVTSHPATAPAATGAYRTPPVKVSPPRRWRPAGSAPQRVAKGSAVAAAHRCTSAGAKTTIRDPATLTNAVQELRAAVAARSLSLALQTNGTSPNQRVRSRPVPTTVTPSRHGQAKSPGHSESPAAPDQQPQSSGKDPTPRVPERRKVAAAAATTTTARVGELFRPMRQENQQQHYRQKRQQPLSPPPSSAPADTLRETSSPMEHSRPPCSVPSSPDTASAATPESDRVLEPRQRTLTQRDGLMHQAGHFRPPFQYPRVDASPSGRLPQALSDMHHRCANGDGVDRESHGLIDSSASSLESPLQGPIRHPGAAEAAIAATGLSTRSGDALPSVLQRLPQPSHHPQRQPSSRSPQREYHGAHADSSESLFAMAAVAAAEARPGIGSATFGRWVQPTPAEGQLFLSSDVMPSDILSWQSSSTTRDLGHRRHGAHGVERGGGDQGRAGCAGGGGGSDRDRGGNGEEKRGGDRKDNAGPSGSNDRSGIGGDGGGEDPSDSSDGDGDGDDDMGEASEQAEGEEEDQDNASELSLRNKAVAAASTARAVIRQKPAADGFPPAAAASRAAAELDTDTQSPRKYRSPPRVRPRSGAQFPERGGDESQFNSDGSHDSNHFTGGAARVHRHHGRSGAGGTGKVPIQARPQPQPRESASPLSPSSPLASSPLPYTTMATARAATDAAAASHAAARAKFGSSPSPSPSPSPATAGSSPPSSRVGQRSRPPSPLSASASPSLREADLVARCRELEGQLAGVYREMDELVSRAQGTKGVVSNGADDLRQQLATMEAALAALEAENRELREAVRHSRTTYENAAALAAKMARLQEKVDLLTLDKRELEVQLDLARLSPRSATPGKGTSPRPSPPDTAHQQQHIIEALLEQVAELQQEKAALQEQLTQRAGLQQQQQQHQPAYKSARKGYAAATATATAPASAAADSGSTPRTVPRTAPAQVAAYPPPRSRSQSRSPLASPAAANASKVAGKSGSRGDADGVMMARIAQLQRQVRVLTAENDSLRCQGAVARAGPSEHQAQIRNLQGQVQSLGQQLESERWVRSHLNDMQAQAAGPTTAHQRQSPPPVSQHTQQQAAPRRSSVSLPPPPQHQPQPHQSRQRQQQQPYGRVAKAIVYGPISSPPSGGKLVADFQVTVEPLGPGRQGRVASPAAREGGPSFMQDGYR